MRKLVRQVTSPGALRPRHLAIAATCLVGAVWGLYHELHEPEDPRWQIAREQEATILEDLNRHPPRGCPTVEPETYDPWGDAYQIVCHPETDRLIVTVVSHGDGDGRAIATSKTFWR